MLLPPLNPVSILRYQTYDLMAEILLVSILGLSQCPGLFVPPLSRITGVVSPKRSASQQLSQWLLNEGLHQRDTKGSMCMC